MAKKEPRYRSRRPALHHGPLLRKERPRLGVAGGLARVFIDSPRS